LEECAGWPTEPYLVSAKAEEFARCLGNAFLSSNEVMQAAFPLVFEAFVSNSEKAEPEWKPIYATLLTPTVDQPTILNWRACSHHYF
jgi:hypothetical protein